jgi:hypothetical protein
MDHGDPEATGCRIREFARWDRRMLQHEREAISDYLARAGSYLADDGKADLMHDLTDIDYLLGQMPPENNPSPIVEWSFDAPAESP